MVRGSLLEYFPSEIRLITNSVCRSPTRQWKRTHLDMAPDMFSQIADKSLGGINIEWDFVPCPISAPLETRMHSGASQWWFAGPSRTPPSVLPRWKCLLTLVIHGRRLQGTSITFSSFEHGWRNLYYDCVDQGHFENGAKCGECQHGGGTVANGATNYS